MNLPPHTSFKPELLARLSERYADAMRLRAETSRAQAREMENFRAIRQIVEEAVEQTGASGRAAEMLYRESNAELGATLRIHDRTAAGLLAEAQLVDDFPAVFEAFKDGRIHAGHLQKIVAAGTELPDATARARFEEVILPIAQRETPSRTDKFARDAAEQLHPDSFIDRHKAAAACRGVWVVDLPDGMSELGVLLPSLEAHAAFNRIKHMARSVRQANRAARARIKGTGSATGSDTGDGSGIGNGNGTGTGTGNGNGNGNSGLDVSVDVLGVELPGDPTDERSQGEIEADVIVDMFLTATPAAHTGATELSQIKAQIQIQIPVLTAMGRSNKPATLIGVGPIDPATARELAGAASGWDRVLTDPITHGILAVDRYTPSESLKRTLRVRDEHCRFPGCRQPAHRTDIDHTKDYATGGHTRESNLALLCESHHMMKHEAAWTVVQHAGGILEWTSPTGQVFTDIPASSVRFEPDDEWNAYFARSDTEPGDSSPADATPDFARDDDGPPPF